MSRPMNDMLFAMGKSRPSERGRGVRLLEHRNGGTGGPRRTLVRRDRGPSSVRAGRASSASGQAGEEERDLARGRLRRVRAVDDVLAGLGCARSPRMVPGAALTGSVAPIIVRQPSMTSAPSTTSATSGPEVMNSTSRPKNGLLGVLGVVRLGGLAGRGCAAPGDEAVALALDPAQDLADQAAGDAVGLDQDQGALGHEDS